MAGDPSPSLVVCVLGLSREKGEHFSQQSGIGKSCLCYRFMHPDHDDYIDKHSSLLTLHEFENPVINSVHFLYWGSTTKRYPLCGSPKEQRIQFHVIEQTVFYQDVTSQPFKILTKPDSLEYYIRRATAQIESTGKISYRSRDTITLRQGQTYPSGISGLPRGFLMVIDVSEVGADFDRQIARAERIMEYLQKHKKKFVIVATKRDVSIPASMSRVQHLTTKYETQVFETSASVNLNISDAFCFIALKVLRKEVRCVSDYIPTYEEAAQRHLDQKVSSRQIFRYYLKKTVISSDETVNALENAEEYKDCIHVVGKFETDLLFADHLIELHCKKIGSFAVVKENPQLLLEFLEEFVNQRMDLTQYSQTLRLRRWIRSYFEEHPAVSSKQEGSLRVKRREVASVSPTAKEVNQGYQALHNPNSDASEDSNSYVNYPLPRSPTVKPGTIADYERGQLGSEKQEPDGMLQDFTSPTPRSKPPKVGPESTLLSADPESVMQKCHTVKKVKPRMPPGSSDIKRRAEHLEKLLSGKEELELEPTVAVASLNKSSHPAISLTKEANLHSLEKHSHVDTGFIPSFAQLVKQDSGNVGKNEKPMTPTGIHDIKRRTEHLQKLLSGDGEPTVTDASPNMSSPPMTSFTKEAPLPSLEKKSHFEASFKPFVQLAKQTSDSVGKEASGSSDAKRCPKKLLSTEEEELEPSAAEVPLNKSSSPQGIHSKQKQSPKISQPLTRKSVRPAPRLPASPKLPASFKSAKNDSLKDRSVKPSSPNRLQGEQNNKSLLSQLPPSRLQPSPITVPPPTRQRLQQSPVAPVSGSIPEKELYVPRLPEIKRKLEEKKRLVEQQKVKDKSSLAKSPKIPGTSLSPNNSRPPQLSRHHASSYPAPPPPKESLPSSNPSHFLPPPKQMESSKHFPPPHPPPYQMVLPPSLPQTQMDSSLPPPSPPKRMDFGRSLPNLTMPHEQTFHFPSSYSLGEDCQPPIPQQTSDVLGSLRSTMTTTMLKPSDSATMKKRPLPAEPFTVDSEDDESDHCYECIELGPILAEYDDPFTFTIHHKCAPLSPAVVPVGFRGDSACKEEKQIMSPSSSDIKRHAEQPKKLLFGEEEEFKPSTAVTLLKNSSPVATQYSKQRQSFQPGTRKPVRQAPKPPVSLKSAKDDSSDNKRHAKQPKKLLHGEEEELEPSVAVTSLKTSSPVATQYGKQRQSFQPGTRKPVRPAPYKPPVSHKSAKDDSLEKTPLKLVPPSRFQGEKGHKVEQPQLSQLSPSRLQLSPITSPPPTFQVSKWNQMTQNISGTEMCVSRFPELKRNTEENCSHEQPKEMNQPPTVPTKKNPGGLSFDDPAVYENLPVPVKPIEYVPAVDDNYENWETIGSTDSQFSAGGSPWPVQPPPVPAMRKRHKFSFVNLPVPDKTLDCLPISHTVDDMYVNWETIGYNPAQLRAGESPQPSQHPSFPTNSKPHTFSSDNYLNLPVPDKVLVLPPGGLERQQQLMLESVQQRSPRPIPSSKLPQTTDEKTHSPVSSNKPTPLPRMRSQKTSVSLGARSQGVGVTTGDPTQCTSSRQRTNKLLHEKQQGLKQ